MSLGISALPFGSHRGRADRTFVSIAIVPFLSAGKRPFRAKSHARDSRSQPSNGGLTMAFGFVDRFDGQACALLVLKGQIACGLEDATSVNRLDLLGHFMLLSQRRTSRALMQLSRGSGGGAHSGWSTSRLTAAPGNRLRAHAVGDSCTSASDLRRSTDDALPLPFNNQGSQ